MPQGENTGRSPYVYVNRILAVELMNTNYRHLFMCTVLGNSKLIIPNFYFLKGKTN